jgi:hypothetical protein
LVGSRIGGFEAEGRRAAPTGDSWAEAPLPEFRPSCLSLRGDTAPRPIVLKSPSSLGLWEGFGSMTRRAVRIAWVGVGLCLAVGVIVGVITLIGPPDQPWSRSLRELSTLLDVAALLFWIAIFAIYWARKRGQS